MQSMQHMTQKAQNINSTFYWAAVTSSCAMVQQAPSKRLKLIRQWRARRLLALATVRCGRHGNHIAKPPHQLLVAPVQYHAGLEALL
eukprot:2691104-Amphidinium_carterae.1